MNPILIFFAVLGLGALVVGVASYMHDKTDKRSLLGSGAVFGFCLVFFLLGIF